MKDKWINVSYENDELKPYEEPTQDFTDNYRIGMYFYNEENFYFDLYFSESILRDGFYAREQVLESLTTRKYDDIMAFYLLLGLKQNEVNSFEYF